MKRLIILFVLFFVCMFAYSQVELGGTSHYTKIEADGTLEFIGDATVWNDFVVSPDLKLNQSKGPSWVTFLGSIKALAFDGGSSEEELFFDIQMPHGWIPGSTIYPHIHWAPGDDSGGNVIWYLEYTWANYTGTFPSPTTINSGAVAAGSTAFKHLITPIPSSGGIDGSGKTLSSVLRCRFYRDPTGSDTYSGDAFALSIDFHYETNTVGSRSKYTK